VVSGAVPDEVADWSAVVGAPAACAAALSAVGSAWADSCSAVDVWVIVCRACGASLAPACAVCFALEVLGNKEVQRTCCGAEGRFCDLSEGRRP
jgi:hypothetical protein